MARKIAVPLLILVGLVLTAHAVWADWVEKPILDLTVDCNSRLNATVRAAPNSGGDVDFTVYVYLRVNDQYVLIGDPAIATHLEPGERKDFSFPLSRNTAEKQGYIDITWRSPGGLGAGYGRRNWDYCEAPSPTPMATGTPQPTATATASQTPTATATPTASPSHSPTASSTATASATQTATPSPTVTPWWRSRVWYLPFVLWQPSPTPTSTPTVTPTPTNSPTVTRTPNPEWDAHDCEFYEVRSVNAFVGWTSIKDYGPEALVFVQGLVETAGSSLSDGFWVRTDPQHRPIPPWRRRDTIWYWTLSVNSRDPVDMIPGQQIPTPVPWVGERADYTYAVWLHLPSRGKVTMGVADIGTSDNSGSLRGFVCPPIARGFANPESFFKELMAARSPELLK